MSNAGVYLDDIESDFLLVRCPLNGKSYPRDQQVEVSKPRVKWRPSLVHERSHVRENKLEEIRQREQIASSSSKSSTDIATESTTEPAEKVVTSK